MIINAFNSINNLHGYKLISDSILDKWKGFGRVVVGQWHFAIDIKGNKVTVVDACHQQNMTNNHTIAEMFEADLNTQVQRITDITFPPHEATTTSSGARLTATAVPSRDTI